MLLAWQIVGQCKHHNCIEPSGPTSTNTEMASITLWYICCVFCCRLSLLYKSLWMVIKLQRLFLEAVIPSNQQLAVAQQMAQQLILAVVQQVGLLQVTTTAAVPAAAVHHHQAPLAHRVQPSGESGMQRLLNPGGSAWCILS